MAASFAIDNIGIAVDDLEDSVAFYSSLDFVVDHSDSSGALLNRDGVRLYLFPSNGVNQARNRPLAMDDSPTGLDHVSFVVADLRDIQKWIEEANIPVESGPIKQSWGPTTITVRDPSGVRLWFLCYEE